MTDKKIIIIALILALALGVGGWIYSKNKPSPGPATISEPEGIIIPGLALGNEKAPVTIEEYTNFLCPACGDFALDTLPKIEQDYIKTGKARMIFYILSPLEINQASFCAEKSGKFIEYHDYLFGHQEEISSEQNIFDFASAVGIGMEDFNACYNSEQAVTVAQAWHQEAQKRGVEATPTFFINGEKLVGALSYEEFAKIIDSKLK